MPDRQSPAFDAEEPLACVSYRLRRAARKAAVLFDRALRPAGLRNTQFSLLGALNYLGDLRIGDLAEELATDATTLNRNLGVLMRDGLVEDFEAPDGRIRMVRLTRQGIAKLEAALPLWRAAQAQVLEEAGDEGWAEARDVLRKLERACDR
jgi:DNA-binding MarR family transcriptional regulator